MSGEHNRPVEPVRGPLAPARPGVALLPGGWVCGPEELSPFLDGMILSASGWRAIFAADGDEESRTRRVRPEHLLLVAMAARAFTDELRKRAGVAAVVLGQDTRPTGPVIAQAAVRAFLSLGVPVRYLFVTASPEIMAYTRGREDVNGFFYVSASHNPVGHNGLKMGLGDGGVAGGEISRSLITKFRALASDPAEIRATTAMLRIPDGDRETDVYAAVETGKAEALAAYRAFTEEVVRGPGPGAQESWNGLVEQLRAIGPGIVADMNGSARAVSIDTGFLTSLGCRVRSLNTTPGLIAHQIVPENEGLAPCLAALGSAHAEDPRFLLGYVPDNDGDRGNLVVAGEHGVRQLAAQEVFALACVAELAWLVHTGAAAPGAGDLLQKPVVVVNGPTSMRIDRIAALFGAEVQRAEVGEANVVGRARELRESGRLARFLGEGSNGGNITHPSAVRDPVQTVLSVLKLLFTPARADAPAPSALWMGLGHRETAPGPDLTALLASLPVFTTTSAYDPLAIMHVSASDHAALKDTVELLWEETWPAMKTHLRRALGVTAFRYENYEGTTVRRGPRGRTGPGRGGFKIVLDDLEGEARAFLWMRGSGTEPVFRVMVDVEGDKPELERELLDVLRDLVSRADATVTGR